MKNKLIKKFIYCNKIFTAIQAPIYLWGSDILREVGDLGGCSM
jgi:hypothetical protein